MILAQWLASVTMHWTPARMFLQLPDPPRSGLPQDGTHGVEGGGVTDGGGQRGNLAGVGVGGRLEHHEPARDLAFERIMDADDRASRARLIDRLVVKHSPQFVTRGRGAGA
jgi:hypothetical protein